MITFEMTTDILNNHIYIDIDDEFIMHYYDNINDVSYLYYGDNLPIYMGIQYR